MDKAVVAQKDAYVGDVVGCVVRESEEDQVAPAEGTAVGYDPAIPCLVLRPSRQLNFVFGEGGIRESGTVHTSFGDAAHTMGRSQKAVGRFDDLFRLGATGIQILSGATVDESLHAAVGDHG